MRATLTLLLVALLAAPAAAHAAGPLPARQLVVRAGDLPGFAGARSYPSSTASAIEWAHTGVSGATWTEAQLKATNLQALGFEQGVRDVFVARGGEAHGRHREALSEAVVLPSAANAQAALAYGLASSARQYGKRGLRETSDRAIPGAMTLGTFIPGHHGGTGNVFFATGRCFFVVGDFIYAPRSPAELDRAPLAGAIALYHRDKPVCA